jgi:hypothetical protein
MLSEFTSFVARFKCRLSCHTMNFNVETEPSRARVSA